MKEREPLLISAGRFTSRGKWIHPKRCLDSSELIVVVEGSFSMAESDRLFDLREGSVLFLEEGLEHGGVDFSHERISFYWFHLQNFQDFREGGFKKHTQLTEPYAVNLLCRQILSYRNGDFEPSVAEHLLQVLLAEIGAQSRKECLSHGAPVARIREWIRINADRGLTVAQIAEHFGYNEDYLSRLFKKNYGKSLKCVIDEMKAAQIKRLLLDSDLTLYQIAEQTSFEDYKLFLKFFKYHEGVTPTEFRNLYSDIHTNNQ